MDLSALETLHGALSCRAYHYGYGGEIVATPYVVWAEDGSVPGGGGDNRNTTRILTGTTDLYTRTVADPVTDEIEHALDDARIAWRLASIQYEDGTGLIHYEWSWEVPMWPT